jgi:hypothetical protein
MQLSKQEQQYLAQQMNKELERMTMSWDNELREWHPYALQALSFSSAIELQVPQHRYGELLKTDDHGVNMNVVMVLCNNMEGKTPAQMGYTLEEWAVILQKNAAVAQRWVEFQKPVQRKVEKEFEIMRNKPKLAIIPGQA